jgi:hypothetical protein
MPRELNHKQGYNRLLIKRHILGMYAESEVELHTFLNTKPDGQLQKQ